MYPLGPLAIALRGSFLPTEANPRTDFETYGSTAHRITPERVVHMLEALMAEAGERQA
jgi:hypothetical protein